MDQYRVILAGDAAEAERQMNALANQGYRLASLSASADDGRLTLVAAMEYGAATQGGRAGTVESEALAAGIPSQGPTAERQLTEPTLGTGQVE